MCILEFNVFTFSIEYLLSKQDLNIFAVDWASLAKGPCYPAAVWNTRHVGKCTAQLINRIRETGAKDIHFIGFSLGGQLANFVANNLQPYKLPRITGLDPAGPGFLLASNDNKLDKSDALFVDVVHTNAFIQGTYEESGHVDFFINGGVIQPGCWAQDSNYQLFLPLFFIFQSIFIFAIFLCTTHGHKPDSTYCFRIFRL